MREWIIGAFINILGSIAINFGTNLLKLGHDERERHPVLGGDGMNGKTVLRPIFHFQTWRIGIFLFAFGNCLNFISFGYAAQSLLAALGSIQFLSNLAFAYYVLNKTVPVKVLGATAFIILGNIFLVSFGNHQSPVYTPEQLTEKFSNIAFLLYCLILVIVVAVHHYIYRIGEVLLSVTGHDIKVYWVILLPFSYAVVSGAVGSCSVLFAKSLSNLLRLSMSSDYQLHSWFTYSMLLLFLSTAGFWMARLNEGLSMFDAILIVPMFQIVWTFFSICTGFVYFQEYQVLSLSLLQTPAHLHVLVKVQGSILYVIVNEVTSLISILVNLHVVFFRLIIHSLFQFWHDCLLVLVMQVFDTLRTTVFILGMVLVFIGISLLAPDEPRGSEVKDSSLASSNHPSESTDTNRLVMPSEDSQVKDMKSFVRSMQIKAANAVVNAKAACSSTFGLGEDSIHTSSVFAMPMVSSKINGFRGNGVDRAKYFSWRDIGRNSDISLEEHDLESASMLPRS